MFSKKTLADIDPQGKRILMRVDFNVPLRDGKVSEDTRIRAALPSINDVLKRGGVLILMSHLGRPKGQIDPLYSLRPLADYLQKLINVPVAFAPDCLGPNALSLAKDLKSGEILLLENTRFHAGEKKNDPDMAKGLAKLADLFVNDAFGSAHRAHASTVGVTDFLPSVAGFLLEKEVQYIEALLQNPSRPFMALLGGAKIVDKILVVEKLLEIADKVLIGGGMANTFLAASGFDMADSLVDKQSIKIANKLLLENRDKLILPTDLTVASEFSEQAEIKIVNVQNIPSGWQALDIGPETIANYSKEIMQSKTVIWNGPMGVFEIPAFAKGSNALAQVLADSQALSIVGGGDSAAAIEFAGLTNKITHVSTGGGASLRMLAGKKLPALEALDNKE